MFKKITQLKIPNLKFDDKILKLYKPFISNNLIYPILGIIEMKMIKDTIDDGSPSDLDSAKDYLDQFKEYLVKKEAAIQQQDPRHNQYGGMPINYDR